MSVRLDVRSIGRCLVEVEVEQLGYAVADPDSRLGGSLGEGGDLVPQAFGPGVVLAGEDELVLVGAEDLGEVGPGMAEPLEILLLGELTGRDRVVDRLGVKLRPRECAWHPNESQPRVGAETLCHEDIPIQGQQVLPDAVVPDRQVGHPVVVGGEAADTTHLREPFGRPVDAAGEDPHPVVARPGQRLIERLEAHRLRRARVRIDRPALGGLQLAPGLVDRAHQDTVRR